eukprot:3263325-Rhodomonas_salina.1
MCLPQVNSSIAILLAGSTWYQYSRALSRYCGLVVHQNSKLCAVEMVYRIPVAISSSYKQTVQWEWYSAAAHDYEFPR